MQDNPKRFSMMSLVSRIIGLVRVAWDKMWCWGASGIKAIASIVSDSESSSDRRWRLSIREKALAVQAAHSAALDVLGMLDPESDDALPTQDGSTCFPNRDEFNNDSDEMTRMQILQSAGIAELGHSHTINQSILALLQ